MILIKKPRPKNYERGKFSITLGQLEQIKYGVYTEIHVFADTLYRLDPSKIKASDIIYDQTPTGRVFGMIGYKDPTKDYMVNND